MSNNHENGEAGVSNPVNNEEEYVYEEYGGHYAEYELVVKKNWKRKWLFIGLAFVLIIISIAIGLGIHFGKTSEPLTTSIPQTLSTSVTTLSTSLAPTSISVTTNSTSSKTDRSGTVVLSLSTYLPSNVPMLIGLNGMPDLFCFFLELS